MKFENAITKLERLGYKTEKNTYGIYSFVVNNHTISFFKVIGKGTVDKPTVTYPIESDKQPKRFSSLMAAIRECGGVATLKELNELQKKQKIASLNNVEALRRKADKIDENKKEEFVNKILELRNS
ncbi:hypothetical protein M0R19_03365 [Candidatus Pacearchaeota archaeon]|jgi:hypothetical protein|nr:hypothetical protein [Candidatus Pacearchaeota archaeon]